MTPLSLHGAAKMLTHPPPYRVCFDSIGHSLTTSWKQTVLFFMHVLANTLTHSPWFDCIGTEPPTLTLILTLTLNSNLKA